MIWKPKEKELTAEEAVALAKTELAPFWYGSEPLLAGVDHPGAGVTAHPLAADFAKKSWLMFFLDPSEFSGESALNFAREWNRRYSIHGLGHLVIFIPPYGFLKGRNIIQALREKMQITFPMAVDADGRLSQAFGAADIPKVILMAEGRKVFDFGGRDWAKVSEREIQKFLRLKDPGLPLLTPYQAPRHLTIDISRMEFGFGAKRGVSVVYPTPGFKDGGGVFRAGAFKGERSDVLVSGELFITGTWVQDAERIATSDPRAALGFHAPSSRFSLIAESLSKSVETPRIWVELGGAPAYDAVAGEGLTMQDDGQSVVKLGGAQLYHVLVNLPDKSREVTLQFHNADQAPLAIYGFRFGQ